MNRNPLWKNLAVLIAVLLGVLLALPTFFPVDPALQITKEDGSPVSNVLIGEIRETLDDLDVASFALEHRSGNASLRFSSQDDQRLAADALASRFADVLVAFDLAPRLPAWLDALGLDPISLGLDLRGGVHFVYEVDLGDVADQLREAYEADVRAKLRAARVPATVAVGDGSIVVTLTRATDVQAARDAIRGIRLGSGFGSDAVAVREISANGAHAFELAIPEDVVAHRQELAMEQNIATLRNRVDELGVAEPVVQRQGRDRILVEVPGVQDPSQLDRILGSTATLEWRLVDTLNDPFEAARTRRGPQSSLLRFEADGRPWLLQRQVIASGEHLTNATYGYSEGRPAVFIRLGGQGARRMLDTTQANVGKLLAVLMIEETRVAAAGDERGEGQQRTRRDEEVVFIGTIDGVFSSDFRLSGGFTPMQAQDLALVLRSGALAAPLYKVRGRTIGPKLGQDNIRRGSLALATGFAAITVFMAAYYRVFGMIANLALLANLFLMIALLSLLSASLTLPGMAGVVLTLGIAVDANVLIIERIREELARGGSPRASIVQGYAKAWSTIADANVTTLVAGIVLLAFGSGPIKGFAVTLSLGVVTSMFTSVAGTRAVVDLVYRDRGTKRLSIGSAH